MKIGVQLNPQVSIDKPATSQCRADRTGARCRSSGFNAFSMGEHYKIPGQTDVQYRTELTAEDTEGLDKLEEALKDSLKLTS